MMPRVRMPGYARFQRAAARTFANRHAGSVRTQAFRTSHFFLGQPEAPTRER
jgi:hypothetical protein